MAQASALVVPFCGFRRKSAPLTMASPTAHCIAEVASPGDLACVQIRGQIGAGKQVLAEIGCVTVENFGEFLAGNGLFRVFAVGNAVSGGPIAAGFVPGLALFGAHAVVSGKDRQEHSAREGAVGAEAGVGRAVHETAAVRVHHVFIVPVDGADVAEGVVVARQQNRALGKTGVAVFFHGLFDREARRVFDQLQKLFCGLVAGERLSRRISVLVCKRQRSALGQVE